MIVRMPHLDDKHGCGKERMAKHGSTMLAVMMLMVISVVNSAADCGAHAESNALRVIVRITVGKRYVQDYRQRQHATKDADCLERSSQHG